MRTDYRTIILSLAGLTFAGGAANAADLYTPPPAAPPPVYSPVTAYDWSGFYIGVQGGYDWNHATTPPAFAADENGGIVGVYGGYNWMFTPNWLLGIDGSINYSWASGSDPTVVVANSAGPTWKGLVRGRLGYTWDRFLVYGTAGVAGMGYTATVLGATGTATPWGWTVGLGAEMAITQNVTARLDYAYQDYGSFTLSGPAPIGGTPVSVKSHTLMVGLAAKF